MKTVEEIELRTFDVKEKNRESVLEEYIKNQKDYQMHFVIHAETGGVGSIEVSTIVKKSNNKYLVLSANLNSSALFSLDDIKSFWYTNKTPNRFYVSI